MMKVRVPFRNEFSLKLKELCTSADKQEKKIISHCVFDM